MANEDKIEFLVEAKDKFSPTFTALRAALASIVAGGLLRATQAALDFAGSIKDVADRVDSSTGSLQEWRVVAQQSGASAEKMDQAMLMFSRTMGEAATGSRLAQKDLERVGVTLEDLRSQSSEQIFEKTRDAISEMGSASQRNQALMSLFGRQGRDLGVVFSQSSEQIAKMRGEAQELGAVLNEATIKKAKEASDKLAVLHQVIKVQLTAALVELGPILVQATKLISFIAPAAKGVAFVVNGLSQGFQELGVSIGAYAAAAEALFLKGGPTAAGEIIKQMKLDIAEIQRLGEESRAAIFGSDAEKKQRSPAATFQPIDPDYIRELQKQVILSSGIKARALEQDRADQIKKLQEMNVDLADFRKAEALINQDWAQKHVELERELFSQLGAGSELYFKSREMQLNQDMSNMRAVLISEEELAKYHAQVMLQIEADRTTQLNELQTQELENRIIISQTINDQEAQIMREGLKFRQATEAQKVALTKNATLQMLNNLGTFSRTAFSIAKAANIADALMSAYTAYNTTLKAYPAPLSYLFAAGALAAGLAQVNAIRKQNFGGAAHGGLENVPREGTFLLNKGERVLAPEQNRDLTSFLDQGGGDVSIERLEIHVLENATSGDALMRMTPVEMRELVAAKFIPALDALSRRGVRTAADERLRR